MSLKSGLEQNATCIKQVMERGDMGWSFARTALLNAKAVPTTVTESKLLQRREGMPPVGGA